MTAASDGGGGGGVGDGGDVLGATATAMATAKVTALRWWWRRLRCAGATVRWRCGYAGHPPVDS